MASQEKKVKLEETEANSAVGYIQVVSPMKTSRKGSQFFNAKLQESDKVTDIVGFSEKFRSDLVQIESQRTPVKLSNIEKTVSFRSTSAFDIKLTSRSQISPAKICYSFEKIQQNVQDIQQKKIKDIENTADRAKVMVTAKVLQRKDSVQQQLGHGSSMLRTAFIIADDSGSIELTLWGSADQINVGSSYIFNSVTVKTFEQKKLSTNPDTSIKKTEDIKNVVQAPVFKPKIEIVRVLGVTISTTFKCCFCKAQIDVNQEISTVKCATCHKRQLIELVDQSIKCEIKAKKTDDNTITFLIPSEIVQELTGDIPNDDKEIYLLRRKLRVSFGRNTGIAIAATKVA